ncbi:MAG TPA: cyclopropane-fatty-acyl-phospholipid synthase family protein [Steroidobacteraceae bacterium]|nr:cyclopropane-fatty-acyl-phospholipid synthase family protein [Steroidobacteraceae bacterium]
MTLPHNPEAAGALSPERKAAAGVLDSFARRAVLTKLQALRGGCLVIDDGGERLRFGKVCDELPDPVVIHVRDARMYGDVAVGGSVGAGESYMRGYWHTAQLVDVIRLFVLNMDALEGLDGGTALLTEPLRRIVHVFRRNSRAGARRNIAAHYDLGNEFFRLLLDETMMYSAATFEHEGQSLHDAQVARLDLVCRKLDLKPTDHLLEIGSGWGGMALHAARQFGCRVTTTTISREQWKLTSERVREAGLDDHIQVLCSDYRDLTGQFDKLVSIEMIEAIGHSYYDTYFAKCANLLAPHGAMLLQSITIADQRYERASRSVDFIKKYIFPGSCIPSVAALSQSIARASDLRIFHLEDIGPHYATTLAHWRQNFRANLPRIRALGYDETFIRMWEYYLAYCEGGFAERAIGDAQLLLVKPGNRRAPL